jgi:hypothetical protein
MTEGLRTACYFTCIKTLYPLFCLVRVKRLPFNKNKGTKEKITDLMIVVWTDYMKYKAKLRGFDLAKIENIVRSSPERYIDTVTGRRVAVGRHDNKLVIIPYEADENSITPVTIHVTTRQQINFRIRTGRFTHE